MATFSASQTEDLRAIKESEKPQLEVKMCTFMSTSNLPPPYTVIDVAPTPVPPEIVQSQLVGNQVHSRILNPGVLKKNPVYVYCPNCNQGTVTSVQLVNTQKTHMLAGFICGVTFWCMLCCLSVIPYIVPTCKNAGHYCSHCNYFLGSYTNSK